MQLPRVNKAYTMLHTEFTLQDNEEIRDKLLPILTQLEETIKSLDHTEVSQ